MAVTNSGINLVSKSARELKSLSARVTNSILDSKIIKDVVPDAFVLSAKVPSKAEDKNFFTRVLKWILPDNKSGNSTFSNINKDGIKKPLKKSLNEFWRESKSKFNSVIDDVKNAFLKKSGHVADNIAEKIKGVSRFRVRNFSDFKKAVENSPAVKFVKDLLKAEEKKVNQRIVEQYQSNKSDYTTRKRIFEETKAVFDKKLELLHEAIKSGNLFDVKKAKAALNSAKSMLEDAKAYLDIAFKYFKASTNRVADLTLEKLS